MDERNKKKRKWSKWQVATFWVFGTAAVAAGGSARAGDAAGAAAVAVARTPGMTMRSPTFTCAFGARLFALASIITGLL